VITIVKCMTTAKLMYKPAAMLYKNIINTNTNLELTLNKLTKNIF